MSALAISNVVLWVLVLVLAAVVLALVRQLGVLHERIAPAGALMLNRGLTVGEPAPVLEVADLEGRAHQVGVARARRPQHAAAVCLPDLSGVQDAAAGGQVQSQG